MALPVTSFNRILLVSSLWPLPLREERARLLVGGERRRGGPKLAVDGLTSWREKNRKKDDEIDEEEEEERK